MKLDFGTKKFTPSGWLVDTHGLDNLAVGESKYFLCELTELRDNQELRIRSAAVSMKKKGLGVWSCRAVHKGMSFEYADKPGDKFVVEHDGLLVTRVK